MTERWVFNASPLILLGKAGELSWVPHLGAVVVPQGVAEEVLAGPADDAARRWLAEGEGGALIQADGPAGESLLAWDLGAGETAVIAWAARHRGTEAVLDDAAARNCARVFGVQHRGTLSLVALAKRRGFVASCRPVFSRLQSAGLFVTPALVEQVAASAGE